MQDLSQRKTSLKEWDLGHDHKDVSPNTEMTKDQKPYSKFSTEKKSKSQNKILSKKKFFFMFNAFFMHLRD